MIKKATLLPIIMGCIFTISFSSVSSAATFCVSDATELQDALTTAASNWEDDVVQIEQGTYVGNFVYESTQACNLTIEGGYTSGCASREVDASNTVLDGGASGRVLTLSAPGWVADFSVDGVTLMNGSLAEGNGGGLYVDAAGETTVSNNTITDNSAADDGGGVYASDATLTIADNIITDNSANHGGGLSVSDVTLTLTDNDITGNSTSDAGGGVYAYNCNNTLALTNNTITENSASNGGGMYIYSNSNATLTLTDNIMTGNSASNGGGIYVYSQYRKTHPQICFSMVKLKSGTFFDGLFLLKNNNIFDKQLICLLEQI